MKRVYIWTTPLHKKTLAQLASKDDKFLFQKTNGKIILRLFSLIYSFFMIFFFRIQNYQFVMPRVASFEFLLIRYVLHDEVILSTDGISDVIKCIEPKFNVKIFNYLYDRPVDINFEKFQFHSIDLINYNENSKNVLFYEKLPVKNLCEFKRLNSNYNFIFKKKGDSPLRCDVKYIVSFPSTTIFEHVDSFPKENFLVIKSSMICHDRITKNRHSNYESYFSKDGYNMISLNDKLE